MGRNVKSVRRRDDITFHSPTYCVHRNIPPLKLVIMKTLSKYFFGGISITVQSNSTI